MRQHQIAPNGYSPFEGKGTHGLLSEPELVRIARAHNVSSSQVVLNWQWTRHGVLVNPTATSAAYQRLNLDFEGVPLTAADLDALDAWPQSPLP